MSSSRLFVPVLALLLSVACVTLAQIVAKLRLNHFGPVPIDRGVIGYIGRLLVDVGIWTSFALTITAAVFYYVGLSRLPLNNAIFFTALAYPAVTLGSLLVLGEAVSLSQLAGMVLVMVGVVVVVAG